jgi:hypothetical protein
MGWYYGYNNSRADIIREITTDGAKTLRKFTSGNTLWTVQETKDGAKFIGCYLLQRAGRNEWGYKPMDESMHPYYYSCPLAFLNDAPSACEEWRLKVRAYHAERAPILAARRAARNNYRKL